MKPFNLEEYLANPSKKMVTREGKDARIICTDREDSIHPIIALIKDNKRESEILVTYTKDGIPAEYNEAYYTLFFAPEKHEGWINIYKNERDHYFGKFIYPRRADAEAVADSTCIATTKIEWEE